MPPRILAFLSFALVAAGCVFVAADSDEKHESHEKRSAKGPSALAKIDPRSGSNVTGIATFEEVPGGVRVRIEIQNAPPGWHAVHVHEKGDCSAPDGSSAGGHFNPAALNHGAPHAVGAHHAGDLGNMEVGEDGKGYHEILMPDLSVSSGPNSVIDRSIIIHAGVDDLVTQPTGNAGGRIGCGVIH
jgi:Cu-Zn family superoxide dismutase